MSIDFALKELYRKRKVIIPYILTISLIINMSLFFIHFLTSLNLSALFSQQQYNNIYFFTGATFVIYSQFFSLLIILMFILSIVVIMFISYTYIKNKKADISVMKALGTLPEKLYEFYLIETFFIFIFGFTLGFTAFLIAYFFFIEILNILNFNIFFQINIFFTALLFILGLISCLITAGWLLRKIGKSKIFDSLSKDVPFNYSFKKLKYIPKWLSSKGKNIKHSVLNSVREKGRFRRYLFIFGIIGLIMCTISLGAFVLDTTSRSWINKSQASQSSNIIAIGHKDVVNNYTDMYNMFSDPSIFITEDDIPFNDEKYFFNFSQIQSVQSLEGIQKIDERIISFCDIQEQQTLYIDEEGDYHFIGQTREATLPVIGINVSSIIPTFEFLQGNFFTQENASDMVTISDGLANNLFETPMLQEIAFTNLEKTFGISGVIFDTFYSGYASYIDINEYKSLLNTSGINLLLLELDSYNLTQNLAQINEIITLHLGENFTAINLRSHFEKNLILINTLTIFNIILLISISIISLFSIYQFQKGDLTEKLNDFLIMHAIGSKLKNLKRILFFEGLFVIIPAISVSFAGSLIINSLFLFDRSIVVMPSILLPLLIYGIILLGFILLNYLVLIPLMKKIKKASVLSMKKI
ncbi:MAG: ABC transporter permease [Promethearchaeota archaeon]|nr:MAG: ABC transporter permease [Candidatus Lokiarchaeota archaeon]